MSATGLSAVWAGVARVRVRAYEKGWLPRRRLSRPTISVGALEMGGTGKTPATAMLARLLAGAGHRPAILSRGYGRRAATPLLVSRGRGPESEVRLCGDEPYWYACVLPGVAVAVAAQRERAAALVAERHDLFLLDDAFQHVRVQRDVDLLVVDGDAPFWRQAPPPRGRLREEAGAAARAHAFLLHGCSEAAEELRRRYPDLPVFLLRRRCPGVRRLDDFLAGRPPQPPPSLPAFLFAAIARPRRLQAAAREAGVALVGERFFRDHRWYCGADLDAIERAARRAGAEILVTSEKDAVRLLPLRPLRLPLLLLADEMRPQRGDALLAWLQRRLPVETPR